MPSPDVRRYVQIRSASDPSLSPDDRRLAFLTNITGINQVWTVPVEGGWPDQVTWGESRATLASYSPVTTELIVASDIGGNEREQLRLVQENGDGERPLTTDAPEAIHLFGGWSPDGQHVAFSANRRNPAFLDLYLRRLDSDENSLLLETNGWFVPVGWLPDGEGLIVREALGSLRSRLYVFSLRKPGLQPLLPEMPAALYADVRVDRTGRVLCVTDVESDIAYPAAIGLDGSWTRYPSDADWEAEHVVALGTTGLVAWTTNRDGASELIVFDERRGEVVAHPSLPVGVISGLQASRDGRLLAFALSGPRHPSDIWTFEPATGRLRQVTQSFRAGIPRERFVEPRLVRFPTFDGRLLTGWLYLPPGARMRPPCIVDVHGGPEAQARPDFRWLYQYYLAAGYAVFAPNVRGSTGYGRAFTHLDDGRKRMDAVRDLEYANRWLRASGRVDPERIAITGGSYGGFMVLAALATQPDRWAAGAETVGIANFLTFLEQTGPWRRALRIAEYGDPVADRDFLSSISPINHVDAIRAPLLVLHGANDPRVPVGEAEQIVAALRARGHPVEYLRFEDEGHGIAKLENKVVAYQAVVDFLNRVLSVP
ncbi:MAG: peptidase S9 [Dehalococcoidia bacterium]|nr:MAG: peptidase S9 [Dehalococcoidia bacterium]